MKKSRKNFLKGLAGVFTLGWLFSGNEEANANKLNKTGSMSISDPTIGQITMFAGNFAPRNWAFCDGQLLPISENSALFSILGTTYGGDGRTTFGLPDLRSRVPIHAGRGPGLTERRLGAKGGSETNSLTQNQLPSHSHSLQGTSEPGTSNSPDGNIPAVNRDGILHYGSTANVGMGSGSIGETGGGQPVNNMQPYLGINYIIALQGIFPSRS